MALVVALGLKGALSPTSGLFVTLVGVVVAVALFLLRQLRGLSLERKSLNPHNGAGQLPNLNIVCVILSGLVVFLGKGISPRFWFEREMAKPYVVGAIFIWSLILL